MYLTVQRWGRRSKALMALPAAILALWRREFHDSRVILEQQGDLKYFAISAQLQRNVVRGLIVVSGAACATLLGLLAFAVVLSVGKARLERSHHEIYEALLGSAADMAQSDGSAIGKEEMLALAQTIRERDIEIRRFVDSSTTTLTADNSSLKSRLDASGLSEKAIKIIHTSASIGGFGNDQAETSNPLLSGKLSQEIAKNRDLMDVLTALPARMPLDGFSTTSSFGIRMHPISGRPKFHTGIDLIPLNGDEVRPAKPGKVVLSRPYNEYGNTVIVRHDRGIETLYGHLADLRVREGQDVDLNSVLGMVGNTGSSTGKHLHFEVSVGGYPVDPKKVIETAYNVQKAKN